MRRMDEIFVALAKSPFRAKFALGKAEQRYLAAQTLDVILEHGREFVATRLAPATPQRDGKQTPLRGHPVFVAQHATGTCCRGCLAKWHWIPKGRALTSAETQHVLNAIRRWLVEQMEMRAPSAIEIKQKTTQRKVISKESDASKQVAQRFLFELGDSG